MHFIIGLLGLGLTLAYTLSLNHSSGFQGVFHVPSMILLGLAPLFITIATYPFRDLLGALRAAFTGLRHDEGKSRAQLFERLNAFAAEVRQRRPARALELAEGASHPLLRQLGPLVVRQYSGADIEATSATALYALVSRMRRSEEVFATLSRVAPATGLVGTVLGLIALLKDLSRFDQLGPSMALALLCTLYGLLLANALYQPLARMVHRLALVRSEEAKLLTRALVLVAEDKPVADVRKLFEAAGTGGAAAAGAQAGAALSGGEG